MMKRSSRIALGAAFAGAVVSTSACAPRAFDRYLRDQRWADASRAFSADSALMNDEHALYAAGILYASPTRATYDPARAEELFRRLLSRFPNSRYRGDAADRVALLDELTRSRDSATVHRRDVESQIAGLEADVRRLHTMLDSLQSQNDLLRRNATRAESDLRDRDEQLRALRLELRQLKDVDLKPRPSSPRPPPA